MPKWCAISWMTVSRTTRARVLAGLGRRDAEPHDPGAALGGPRDHRFDEATAHAAAAHRRVDPHLNERHERRIVDRVMRLDREVTARHADDGCPVVGDEGDP